MALVSSSKLFRFGGILASGSRLERCVRCVSRNAKRRNSTSSRILERLVDRCLIRVAGTESFDFLQGLLTNDMRHFEAGAAAIYAMFLNTKGRVLYDSLVYKRPGESTYYVECDVRVADDLQRHLRMYRVRRKVEIDCLADATDVWSTFDPESYTSDEGNSSSDKKNLDGQIFPCGGADNKSAKLADDVAIYEDPRVAPASLRILSNRGVTREKITERLGLEAMPKDAPSYREFRYKLGIGEGVDDLPVGKALPLEANCDYLHGVSFHKGCYIGQELTARTHHTGVVRKRLMPLTFRDAPTQRLDYDDILVDESGKVVGKFRARDGIRGLGLMRISEALNARTILVKDCPVTVAKPRWWPKEAQRDKAKIDIKK